MKTKTVTLEYLKSVDYCIDKISKKKLIDGTCIKCKNNFEYSCVIKFMRNRKNKINKKHLWDTCPKCWLVINTAESSEWIQKNRDAQLIAQNKPEQKLKNAEAVSKSWTNERKIICSEYLKNRWKNDVDFKKKALYNISWTQRNDDRFREMMRKSIGIGGLKGVYNGLDYDSALELSYILWCESNSINIKRYDLNAIEYLDENGKNRLYIPDFIINNNTIIEIKGFGLFYKKNYLRNIKKIEALKNWTLLNNYDYRLIFSDNEILIKNYNTARKLHYEIEKQKNNKV